MQGLDEVLSHISHLSGEINASYMAIPEDNDFLHVCSPIDEMYNNLRPYENFLKFAHLNSVSIPLHRDEIYRAIKNLDIIAFSETNIKHDTPSHLYKFEGFKLFHVNREGRNNGGVGVLIKNELAKHAKKITVNYKELQPELIFVETEINNIKVLISCIYKSPSTRYGVYGDIAEILAFMSTKYDHCIIAGDMNIDFLRPNSAECRYFRNNIINPLSFTQIIDSPTRITADTCTLIDLILVNSPDSVKCSGTIDLPGISDHKLIYCSYSLKKQKFKPQIIKRRDFRKFAEDRFTTDMANVDWESIRNVVENNIDEATTRLENIFANIINVHAPIREIKVTKPADASWMTDEVTFLMDLRDKYKDKWNKIKKHNVRNNIIDSPSQIFFHTRFKELRNQVNHAMRKAKYADFNKKINDKLSDSKNFHSNLKNLNVVNPKNKQGVKCHLDPNKLNESFVKNNNAHVSSNHIAKMVRKINRHSRQAIFEFHEVGEQEIIEIVKTLKSNACGIDEISAFFIKLSIVSSAKTFAEIVNASLKSGYFPSRWKKARIKPIPKITEPILSSDFRPISLLIAFSKILEKIVAKQIKAYLVSNNLMDKYQSAYREQHSTITALTEITDHIYKSLDNSDITLLVLLDYSKAFDCANHKLILAKLKSLGFKNGALKWISSYLSNRSQQVVTDNGESTWIELLNGVPQGSILGPLLFTILVSDISKELRFCKYHLYADDTQLYISGKVKDIFSIIKNINSDLLRISEFSNNNCLKLNEGKSVFIILGSRHNLDKLGELTLPPIIINNKAIKRETTVKNLGILFDETMSWTDEINKCISNGYLKIKQAYRYKNFLSKPSKKLLVQSYILSQFTYNSIILQNITKVQMDKIQKFQNTCVRFILNLKKFDHITEGYISLGLLRMNQLREVQALSLMHKIINIRAPLYLTEKIFRQGQHHYHLTRSRFNIRTSRFKTNYGRNCFFNKIGSRYNQITNLLNLPNSVSNYTFKLKIKRHFLNTI